MTVTMITVHKLVRTILEVIFFKLTSFLNKTFRMKKIIYIVTAFIFTELYSQSEFTGIVKYEVGYSSENIKSYLSKNRDSIKDKKQVEFLDNLLLNTKKVNATLKFKNNKAIYTVDDKMQLENHGKLTQKFSILSAGGSNEYYSNIETKALEIKNCETLDECFIIKSNFKKWNLTQETKTVNNYTCFKATKTVTRNNKNKNITAWYTPNIAFNSGPNEYNGLPGLILELENGSVVFRATKIILNPKEKVVIEELKGGKRVSFDEYSELIKKAKRSLFGN